MELDCAFVCNTRLSLGLGCNSPVNRNDPPDDTDDHHQEIKSKPSSGSAGKFNYGNSFPSLTLALPSDHQHTLNMDPKSSDQQYSSADHTMHGRQQASSGSAVSSFSNSSVKREVREVSGGDQEEVEEERISQKNIGDPEPDEEGPRKKLRLTKEQSLILEDSFKEHSTLNPKQKQALANKLNLRPRQVEVWFQNRRARTKLKQTEVDFEMLKKCCETLKEENKRLHKELQELKAMKLAMPPTPFYMQLPAATLTMCPSCETISASGSAGENSSKISFSIGATKPHFYNPFINPSPSAC